MPQNTGVSFRETTVFIPSVFSVTMEIRAVRSLEGTISLSTATPMETEKPIKRMETVSPRSLKTRGETNFPDAGHGTTAMTVGTVI